MSAALRAAAAASGMLPHEILMRLGRGEKVAGFEFEEGKELSVEQRIECLKASAGYYAPKLLGAVIKTPGGDGNPYTELLAMVQGQSRGLPAEVSKRVRSA